MREAISELNLPAPLKERLYILRFAELICHVLSMLHFYRPRRGTYR